MKRLQSIFMALVLAMSVSAFCQNAPDTQSGQDHHGRGEGMGRGRGMTADEQLDQMSKALNLTDDQKAKLKPILEDTHKQMQQLMQDQSLSREDRRNKMQQIHESAMSQAKGILTDEQFKKLQEMHKSGGEGHGEGHGHGHQNPDQSNPH